MRNVLKVVFVIIGTIIGAGFASGKEIYLFFSIYGIYGVLGIVLSSALMGVIIYKVFTIILEKGICTYDKLMNQINPNNKSREVIKIIITIFLLISFYIMVAGFSAYFSQELGIPNIIGTLIMLLLCYLIFMGNIERVIQVNTILIPILIIFIVLLASQNLEIWNQSQTYTTTASLGEGIYKAILYGSYNSILLIPILVSLKKYIATKKQAKIVAILSVIILAVLAISIYGLLLRSDLDIHSIELPMVYVAGIIAKGYQYLYGGIIVAAIYTSALSAGYGILENYVEKPKTYRRIAIIMCLSAIFVSKLGFSNLINSLYPVFGLLGTIQIILIIKNKT